MRVGKICEIPATNTHGTWNDHSVSDPQAILFETGAHESMRNPPSEISLGSDPAASA